VPPKENVQKNFLLVVPREALGGDVTPTLEGLKIWKREAKRSGLLNYT
jgi:hypothetical protein